MQLQLLPPRIAHVAGGQLAAIVMAAYDVGGDWFDHSEGGGWLAWATPWARLSNGRHIAVSIGTFRSDSRQRNSVEATFPLSEFVRGKSARGPQDRASAA